MGVRAEAVIMIEVVEHLDPALLAKLGDVLFGELRPTRIGDDAQLGVQLDGTRLRPVPLRNNDHRFEWTRAEFKRGPRGWPLSTATTCGLRRRRRAGSDAMKPAPGPVTQAAIFERRADAPPPPAAAVSNLAAAAAA